MSETYAKWFEQVSACLPHPWQIEVGEGNAPSNRLVRIPTGFGKTAGAVLAWLYHRVQLKDDRWPRRLVYCLPMRTLVEQTEESIRKWLQQEGVSWNGDTETHEGKVGVHVLMGGSDAGEWHIHPEHPAILIGTQDMLISRALNRGYGSPRARWPMEFGLLNHDALWVLDEVQLMDVGLATSAQLQQFRDDDRPKGCRPCFSWWMSATLQPCWLESVDTKAMMTAIGESAHIAPEKRKGRLWDEVHKPIMSVTCADEKAVARQAVERHAQVPAGDFGRITLVVLNTVDRACAVFDALPADLKQCGHARLIHSRFRGVERATWRREFLSREHCKPGADLIPISTQVVEAGVDISAGCLITDLAPWPSLVQRFGRAARYGGTAQVVVLKREIQDDKAAAPYLKMELDEAEKALTHLTDVTQASLEDFEAGLSAEAKCRLYPYMPGHLLLRKELDELFDTTPDLTGADLDISRFIRTGEERDCQVFWANFDAETPSARVQPAHEAICAVPFYKARKWLFDGNKLKAGCRAFIFDYLDDTWRPPKSGDILPGRTVLVDLTPIVWTISTVL